MILDSNSKHEGFRMASRKIKLSEEAEIRNTSFANCTVSWRHGYDKEFFWISGVLLVIIGTLGLLGNIVTMFIFCKQHRRKNVFNNLLLSLCCYDTLYILSFGSSEAYNALACYPESFEESLIISLLHVFNRIGCTGSYFTTVVISLERYLGICHPHLQFARRSSIFILPVVVLSLGLNLSLLLYATETLGPREGMITLYQTFYWIPALFELFGIATMLFLNGSIISIIHKSTKVTKHTKNIQSKDRKNTTMILLWVVLIFLVTYSSSLTFRVLYFMGYHWTTLGWLYPVSYLAAITNSSVNFLIYCLVGSDFRAELIRLFRYTKNVEKWGAEVEENEATFDTADRKENSC